MARIVIDKNVPMPMRDGVRLATDVYRMDGGTPAPVLLMRTPYNEEQTVVGGAGVAFDVVRAVQAGFAVVIQDVRGRFATVGGQVILPGANAAGPRDQRAVEARDDVLVYSSPVLDRPLEVTGPVELVLFAASSARDTDVTGKLVDVYPDGRAMILTEGILRARYRRSATTAELLEPDEVYELRLNLWATANVFLPGHRIRLEVSSSNFARFGRNSHTGGDVATEAPEAYRPAVNRVFHDAARPSRVVLPIVER